MLNHPDDKLEFNRFIYSVYILSVFSAIYIITQVHGYGRNDRSFWTYVCQNSKKRIFFIL